MTDFDLKPDTRRLLHDAVFGGDKPTLTIVRSIVRQAKLTWPHEVMTVRLAGHAISPRKRATLVQHQARLLSLHPGLLYIFTDQRTPELEKLINRQFKLTGEFYPCQSPANWVHGIQQSIISLRSRELERVHEKPGSTLPTLQDEMDARQLAIGQILRHEMHWQSAVNLWLNTTLLRHRKQLHEVRRKIIEFIASITRSADVEPALSFVFHRAMQKIDATHAFSDFPQVVSQIITDIQMYLPTDTHQVTTQSQLVRDAIAFVHDHATEPVSLIDAADHVHTSSSHLARQFRSQTGMSLIHYLHRLRVTMAKRQLIETNQTILAIALECGFESVEHFHRVFKRQTGMTPHRYRVSNRQ